MAAIHTNIMVHFIIVVRYRDRLIDETWEQELYKEIEAITAKKGQRLVAINGTASHVHLLIRITPTCIIPDMVREIKKGSATFVNGKKLAKQNFQWQTGYACFTISPSDQEAVKESFANQKEFHKTTSFKTEFLRLLWEHGVAYQEETIFDWLEG